MELGQLDSALAGATFDTLYQPIVRIADRRLMAAETLARLNHPSRGVLGADAFVPQIEDAGLAHRLTDFVVQRAIADLAGPISAAQPIALTLNFPLQVLLRSDAWQRLDAARGGSGIAADRLIIELTESRVVDDPAWLRRVLEQVRTAGYRVMLDDLTPEMPGADALMDLPFTGVKFDKGVVQSLASPASAQFVRRTVGMARRRGLTVIAEGVEDFATWQHLGALGVEQAQGFLVARAMAAAAMPAWLEAWQRQPGFA